MADKNDGYYVMAFNSVNHSIQTEKKAARLFKITVIPTPGELSNDCGLSLRFADSEFMEIEDFHKTLTVPADVYFINNEKKDGKRMIKKLL